MEKSREYSKPLMVMEKFVPQEFVATCKDFVMLSDLDFWADVVHDNGYLYSLSSDGVIDSPSMEHFQGSAPTALMSQAYGVDARNKWFYNVTLYRKVYSGSSIPSGAKYNDSKYMVPISGYEDVAIHIGSQAINSYVYVGNNGAGPSDPSLSPTSAS